MSFDFVLLDYLWTGLVFAFAISTVILGACLAVSICLASFVTHLHMKQFMNHQLMLTLFTFFGSFLYATIGDPEHAAGCFDKFVSASASFTITRALAGLWLTIVAVLLCRDLFLLHGARALAGKLEPLRSPELETLLRDLAARLGVTARPRLFTIAAEGSPFVFGLWRKAIVVPRPALSLSPRALRDVLAHELVHIRDRDSLWLLCELACRRLLFFHPLMVVIGRRQQAVIEKAADEEAVKQARISPRDLTASLVEVLSLKGATNFPFALSASRGYLELKDRIECLAATAPKRGSRRVFLGISALSIATTAWVSISQARIDTAALAAESSAQPGLQCSQFHHEKVLESWLKIQPSAPMTPK